MRVQERVRHSCQRAGYDHRLFTKTFANEINKPTDCLSIFYRRTSKLHHDHSCEWAFSFWDELETELVWRSGLTILRLPVVRLWQTFLLVLMDWDFWSGEKLDSIRRRR
jgi:hypothetical protein